MKFQTPMHNTELGDRYRCTMRVFEEYNDGEVLSVQEDGWGEYIAYKRIFGVNVVYTQDDQGFKELNVYTDQELETLIAIYADNDSEKEDFFG